MAQLFSSFNRAPQPATLQEEWFRSWFDSPYYGLLYRHRDQDEAGYFIDRLLAHFHMPAGSHVLDLACGNGRHAFYMHGLGFEVTGVDLSARKIDEAEATANKLTDRSQLHFVQGDIRQLDMPQRFDLVLNLFTSIGYFNDLADNQQVLHGIHQCLRPGGYVVIDFFNADWLEHNLKPFHEEDVQGVHFEVKKRIVEGAVEKLIRIKDGDKMLCFKEQVQLLHLRDFERMFKKEHLHVLELWGDYNGAPFHEKDSQRLILFAQLGQ